VARLKTRLPRDIRIDSFGGTCTSRIHLFNRVAGYTAFFMANPILPSVFIRRKMLALRGAAAMMDGPFDLALYLFGNFYLTRSG
jgi:hypothetical protein